MKKYCYITPDFPEAAFFLALFFYKGDEIAGLIVLPKLYTDHTLMAAEVKQALKNSAFQGTSIPPEAVLAFVTLKERYPLHKDDWLKPSVHYDITDKNQLLSRSLASPEEYDYLIVPSFADGKKLHLQVSFPVKKDDRQSIGRFIKTTDEEVDRRADSAAIYSSQKMMRFNLETMEISEPYSDGIN